MKKLQKGFTLVELLVVIAIIGILATLVLLQLGTARARARDAQRITAINQIRTAVEEYYGDNGSYPAGLTSVLIGPTSPGKYLSNIPLDPSTSAGYGYAWDASGKFQAWAELENKAAAISSDADINSTSGFAGAGSVTINGATEACTAAANDCIYDQGVQ